MKVSLPYRNRWSAEQVADLEGRIERIRDALTDPVGLTGHVMYLDDGSIANIASHLALAGCDINPAVALIEYRLRPDEDVMIRDAREWKPKGEFGDEPQPPSKAELDRQAAERLEEMRRLVPPDLLEQYKQDFIREFKNHAKEGDQ